MFHSIGMPLGLLSAMKPWKPVIITRPATVVHPPSAREQHDRDHVLDERPGVRHRAARRDGRRSSGYETKSRFLSAAGANGPLFTMNMMTDGKWWLSFEVAAQNQIAHHTSLQAEIQSAVAARRGETDERHPVVLGARGEEERLVRHAEERDQETARQQHPVA